MSQDETTRARLLFVHAHPDDETLATGVTMGAYAASGHDVHLLTCTLGEEGEIIPLLVHASDDVRMGAARGLARTRAPGAARLLRQRLSVERDAGVRGVVEDALVRLERDPDRSIDSGAGRK